jgi:hypothetical protein
VRRLICLYILSFALCFEIYATPTGSQTDIDIKFFTTFQSMMNFYYNLIDQDQLYAGHFSSIEIMINSFEGEEQFENSSDQYCIITTRIPQVDIYMISLFFRKNKMILHLGFDTNAFGFHIPDETSKAQTLFEEIATILWQSQSLM